MKVFVSGASGLVGGNCLRHFKEQGWEVVGSHLSYPTADTVFFDTLDPGHSDNFAISPFNPDVIVHCGALTHVDYCEDHIEESYLKTVQSTVNLADIARSCNAKLVLLSTDYVFDGADGPYTEAAPVHPLSVYGRHKLEAETKVRDLCPDHLILRVTNVYGDEARNKNFVARIISQCQEGAHLQLRLPYDQYASPTNALDIARALYLLLDAGSSGLYHIGSTDYMNRVSLAMNVLKYFPEAAYTLLPASTEALQQRAARPLLGGFITRKFNSEFPGFIFSTVDDYIQTIIKEK